jgi:hypothetical protein
LLLMTTTTPDLLRELPAHVPLDEQPHHHRSTSMTKSSGTLDENESDEYGAKKRANVAPAPADASLELLQLREKVSAQATELATLRAEMATMRAERDDATKGTVTLARMLREKESRVTQAVAMAVAVARELNMAHLNGNGTAGNGSAVRGRD